jgi:hypothetical protein
MSNVRVRPLTLLLPLLAACAHAEVTPSRPADPPPNVTRVEVYVAEDWRVEVAHLEAPNQALIRIHGSEEELDGIPLLYRFEATDSGRRWVTQHRGRDRSVLYGTRRADGEAPYRIHLPGSRNARLAERLETVPPGLGDEIAAAYAAFLEQGRVAELQRFDRAYEIGREEEAFERSLERTREACAHARLSASIDWPTVVDERLLDTSIASYCDGPLHALRTACGVPGGADWVSSRIASVTCRVLPGGGEPTLALEGKALRYGAPLDGVNLDQKARDSLLRLPDPTQGTLEGALAFGASTVCADGSGKRFVILSPRTEEMFYGTEERVVQVRQPPMLSSGWFFEPRHGNPRHNPSFRGYDLRLYSLVEIKDGACTLKCGERAVPLVPVEGEAKARVYGFHRSPPPFDRTPHALARDKQGVYYYVDRGASEATAQDFRLYRGRRGAMRRLPMRDIVSDSQGDVFESATGTLRLVVDKDEALWTQRGRSTALKALPIAENLGVIFNELGVYLGEPLGTPCDDL